MVFTVNMLCLFPRGRRGSLRHSNYINRNFNHDLVAGEVKLTKASDSSFETADKLVNQTYDVCSIYASHKSLRKPTVSCGCRYNVTSEDIVESGCCFPTTDGTGVEIVAV